MEATDWHSSQVTGWRCFHCDAVFTDFNMARVHFGPSYLDRPVCQVDAKAMRDLEAELTKYRTEDTALHRQMHAMQAMHQEALRREEERGYSRGVVDCARLLQKAQGYLLAGDVASAVRELRDITGDDL